MTRGIRFNGHIWGPVIVKPVPDLLQWKLHSTWVLSTSDLQCFVVWSLEEGTSSRSSRSQIANEITNTIEFARELHVIVRQTYLPCATLAQRQLMNSKTAWDDRASAVWPSHGRFNTWLTGPPGGSTWKFVRSLICLSAALWSPTIVRISQQK